MRAIDRLIDLANSISPTGTIGDGTVAQLRDYAERGKAEIRSIGLEEARKRLETEIVLNRLVKCVRSVSAIPGHVHAALEEADQVLDRCDDDPLPIPMILYCPRCGTQHVDQATAEWDNPPHRSHLCQRPGCGCVWRPCDFATAGVAAIVTEGTSDNWPGGPAVVAEFARDRLGAEAVGAGYQEARHLSRLAPDEAPTRDDLNGSDL